MKIIVTEFIGEINKVGEILNYEFSINLKAPDLREQFFKERDKALLKHLEIRKRIKKEFKNDNR